MAVKIRFQVASSKFQVSGLGAALLFGLQPFFPLALPGNRIRRGLPEPAAVL